MPGEISNNNQETGSEETTNPEGENNLTSGDFEPSGGKISPGMKILVSDTVKEEIKKEIAVDKASLFTVFGIFASIVTFVSVEIQILKTICDIWNIAGFSLIILASLLMFILLLDYIGRGWRKDPEIKFPLGISLFAMIFLATGFLSASFANEQQCRDNSIYQRYENNFIDKQLELEDKYDNKIDDLRREVEGLRLQSQQKAQ